MYNAAEIKQILNSKISDMVDNGCRVSFRKNGDIVISRSVSNNLADKLRKRLSEDVPKETASLKEIMWHLGIRDIQGNSVHKSKRNRAAMGEARWARLVGTILRDAGWTRGRDKLMRRVWSPPEKD